MINLLHHSQYQYPPLSFYLSASSSSSSLPLSRICLHHHRRCNMARSMYRSVIRTCSPLVSLKPSSTTSSTSHHHRLVAFRSQSSQSESAETLLAVERIEDAIHRIIERRSAPDWLPLLPGSSYWVPPRKRSSYGIADLLEKLANSLTDEELMSLATTRGWPSSAFFLNNNDGTYSPIPPHLSSLISIRTIITIYYYLLNFIIHGIGGP